MWSNFIGDDWRTETAVQIRAKKQYDMNNLSYHNWQHILDCYTYLEKNKVPYDRNLDYAVLYHDIVYDNAPEKEYRSAEHMFRLIQSTNAYDIIMATRGHSIKGVNWQSVAMIKADLHQFLIPEKALENYTKIMDENKKLYDIDTQMCIKLNASFLFQLSNTMCDNYMINNDKFWLEVNDGINFIVDIGNAMDGFFSYKKTYGAAAYHIRSFT